MAGVNWERRPRRKQMKDDLLILIAEDNDDDGYLIQQALKRVGLSHPTYVCGDGQETMDYLQGAGVYADRQRYPMPRMLIMDLRMPIVSGSDVLRWIKEHPKCAVIPTVILTSSENPMDIQQSDELGANAYLVKPPNIRALEEKLRRLDSFWSVCELPNLPPGCP